MAIKKGGVSVGVIKQGTSDISNVYKGDILIWQNIFELSISSNASNVNLQTAAINAGWNGIVPLVVTIESGVVLSGSVAGDSTAALTIGGSFPGGVILVNKGQLRGRGGNGGRGCVDSDDNGNPGAKGGTALTVSSACTVDNQGTIAAGGGGGGGGAGHVHKGGHSYGGGGGGGRSSNHNSSGGGATGAASPGGSGTLNSAGNGGAGGSTLDGGNGGNWGSSGSPGTSGLFGNGGYGGAGGRAVYGNANVTWVNTGTRHGTIT